MRPMLVMGTRPEAIKMAAVVHACQEHPEIDPVVCSTGQHRELLEQVTSYFGIRPDIDLAAMQPGTSLANLTSRCLDGLDAAVNRFQPDCIVAQGDTTSVLAAALVAFYHHLPLVHVEAGLRTGDLLAPFPEEYNRRVAGVTAAVHCAPTERAAGNLLREGADPRSVHITGNTVIDALLWTAERERQNSSSWEEKYPMATGPMVLITAHRRENQQGGIDEIALAIRELANRFPTHQFIFPVHPNPNVRGPVNSRLGDIENVHLIDPAPYPEFVWLLDRASLVLSDSGGVQEEAPALGKPVLVLRESTDRPEAVDAGTVELVGANRRKIVSCSSRILAGGSADRQIHNPYGDGHAAEKVVAAMLQHVAGRSLRRAA